MPPSLPGLTCPSFSPFGPVPAAAAAGPAGAAAAPAGLFWRLLLALLLLLAACALLLRCRAWAGVARCFGRP
eukprot:3976291-Lingulodinium_polyedra.AAC.1